MTRMEGGAGGIRARLERVSRGLGSQRHLLAVRDGVIGALPLVLIGSAFLLLAQPPSAWLQDLLAPYVQALLVPYRMLGGLVALWVCFGTARSLARSHGLDELGAPLLAVASFLVAVGPSPLEAGGWGVSAERLGAGGLFGAIVIALGTVELQRVFVRRRWTIALPASVPDVIGKSFAAIVPGFASVAVTWFVVHVVGVEVVGLLADAARPLVGASDSLPGAWALVLVDSAMWLLGVHPLAVLAAVKPLWLSMLAENMAAAAEGLPLPHVATREFFNWFVWQGGSGGTLGCALLLLRARSTALRTVGRIGIVPALCNVNEPLLFGLPIVMNPRLALPFLLTPLATVTTTWIAMSTGLVARPRLEVLWTLPSPLGAWLSTGGDSAAIALQLLNLGLGMAIWWPFLRRLDMDLAANEGTPLPATVPDEPASPTPALQG